MIWDKHKLDAVERIANEYGVPVTMVTIYEPSEPFDTDGIYYGFGEVITLDEHSRKDIIPRKDRTPRNEHR